MKAPRHWRPLVEVGMDSFAPLRAEIVKATMLLYEIGEEEARVKLETEHAKARYFINDIYQVMAAPCGPDDACLHLNIRRRDGGMIKDWRHFQQIKNEIAGEEREALELYPAESRKVDTANKWHLWVLPEGVQFGLGWTERDINYEENRNIPGMRQRPL